MQESILSNRYKILKKLGEGGFGETFLAEDMHLPTAPRCVVKKLKPDFSDEESYKLARRLFEQEAEILYRLGNHPQIPNLLAHFEEAGEFYLVQELVEGETLAQELERGKRYNEGELADLLKQLLGTLSFVHEQKVIHRDIKPSNLIRRFPDGKIFLIDFGAVKQVSINPLNGASFQSTVAIGSAGYAPSEQAAGKPSFASDIYAAGLVAIEALTGSHPLNLAQNAHSGEFVWQHKVVLQPDLKNFVTKLVRYDYRQRWRSAIEALAALNLICFTLGYNKRDENFAPIEVIQPKAMEPPKPLMQPAASLPPAIIPTTKFIAPSPIPPTLINRSPQTFRDQGGKKNSGFWNNDFAIAAVVIAAVLGVLAVGGFVLVSSALKSDRQTAQANSAANSSIPKSAIGGNLSAFQEGEKQAEEAAAIEKKATTYFEWEEISNKYRRASQLMDTVDSENPDYEEARTKSADYQKRSAEAQAKASEIKQNGPIMANTNSQVAPASGYSNYPTGQTTTTSSAPTKKARMPGKRREKMYISYSSSGGDYVGGGQDRVFTENDGNFSASISNNQITIRFNGGSDWWTLNLAGPQNMKLTPGSYGGAQRCAFHSPTRPGLDFGGSGRGCNKLSGSFTINNVIFGSNGASLVLLDATFVQNCEESAPPLMGRVYYDARLY